MLKIIVLVVIIALAVASILFGTHHHQVLAGICAYLSVLLLVLTVWHFRCLSAQRHEEGALAYQRTQRPASANPER